MKHYYFLAGLPRSGSTLLSAILNQNPKIFSSKTSSLSKKLHEEFDRWYSLGSKDEDLFFDHIRNVISEKYSDIIKPVIIDKSRDWNKPNIIRIMKKILNNPVKIIASVRNLPDCATSFVKIANPNDVNGFLNESNLINYLIKNYHNLHKGYISEPKSFLFVDYDDLIIDPKKEMEKIEEFLEIENFIYDFENIDVSVVEESDEEIYGIPNLHTIRPKIEKRIHRDSKFILGDFYEKFDKPIFWK